MFFHDALLRANKLVLWDKLLQTWSSLNLNQTETSSLMTFSPRILGCLYGRRDGTFAGTSPCMYISLISPFPFIWKECLPERFSSHPGKAGSRFAQPGSRLKRDNFYHINTSSRFAGMILCWVSWKHSHGKAGMKSVPQTSRPASHINSF